MGWYNYHPEVNCQTYGATFAYALSLWRRTVAILGAAAFTPIIHGRYYTE
jgi:hypothetical protein